MNVYMWDEVAKAVSVHEVPDRLARHDVAVMGALVDAQLTGDLGSNEPLRGAEATQRLGAVRYAGVFCRDKRASLYFMADPEDDPGLAERWAADDLREFTSLGAAERLGRVLLDRVLAGEVVKVGALKLGEDFIYKRVRDGAGKPLFDRVLVVTFNDNEDTMTMVPFDGTLGRLMECLREHGAPDALAWPAQ